jgi:GNAT superfamily N-acetyltransferase
MTQTLEATRPAWPAGLRDGAVRWSRRSRRYDATVAFYRDLVRLPVLAGFAASFGEDGTVFGLPGSSIHLEILRERDGDSSAVGQDEIVLYLDGHEAVEQATAGLHAAGVSTDCEGHPYWEANGAVTYRDPDGRALVFAPWVFGRVPDPVDRPAAAGDVDWYRGERTALRSLFEEAEDSALELDSYIDDGDILVARVGERVVGHLQLVGTKHAGEVELKSMAVVEELRGTGIGRSLVEHALAAARAREYERMVVATAAADIDNLRFYQRRGFRFYGVDREAFGLEAGYAESIVIDGIPLRDRVWLDQPL